jgi:hypothetical protein
MTFPLRPLRLSGSNIAINLIAVLVLTLLWALFFWRLLTPAQADRLIFPEGDFTQHYYAFADYQTERLVRGEFPLWNPYNHAGDPFAGNIQFVAFYPPRLLSAVIAGADGLSIEDYQLEVAAHYWLASLLMYAFLRVLFRRPSIALAGSILYAYGGYLTGYPMLQPSVLQSVVWLPLILLGLHLSVTRAGWLVWGCCLAGIGVALSLLGGHPQTTMHITYLSLAYLAFMAYSHRLRLIDFFTRAALFGVVGAGLAMIQLLPALEFTRLSHRIAQLGYEDKANGFLPVEFLQVIWPGLLGVWSPLYVGVGGLLLAVGAMLRPRPVHVFWMGVIVVALFLSLGGGSIVFDAFYLAVPGFGIFRQQERAASLFSFALVMLAVYQLDWLLSAREESDRRFSRLVYGHAVFLLAAYVVAVVVGLLLDEMTRTASVFGFVALIGGLFALWYAWIQNYTGARWSIIAPLVAVLIIDLFTLGTRSENFLPDIPKNRVQPRAALADLSTPPQEIAWRVDGAASLQGYSAYFRVPDIYGTGPFSLDSIEELRLIPVDRFWEVLAVRYVTTTDEPPEDVALELLAYDVNYTGDEYKLFELQDPRPIAHLVYDYRVAEDNLPFARQIMSDPRVNLREMAVTTAPLSFDLSAERPELSRVEGFTMVTPERVEMTVFTGADALLTVAIPNYPGWRATINNQPAQMIDTYAGLIGIPVRAGEDQHITLEFRPDSVLFGGIITALTLAVVIALCVAVGVRRRRQTARTED